MIRKYFETLRFQLKLKIVNLKFIKWLAKEAQLRIKYMTSKDCIFCQMVNGEIKTQPILETDKTLAIADINPVAPVHILIIPKRHIESPLTIDASCAGDMIDMFEVSKKLVDVKKLSAYRLTFNGGKYQHVPHLHMHLLAGGKIEWSKL